MGERHIFNLEILLLLNLKNEFRTNPLKSKMTSILKGNILNNVKVFFHFAIHSTSFCQVLNGNILNNVILSDITWKCCHVELKEVKKDEFIKNGW